jgi:hypothetical protein
MMLERSLLRGAVALLVTGALLSVQATAHAATPAPDDSPVLAPDTQIVLNDGTVIGPDETITFTFQGDKPEDDGNVHAQSCPEVNDRPTYTVTGKLHFIADKSHPQSSWLEPRQSVDWAVSGSHTFTWDVKAGFEVEAGAILAKAKIKVDVGISNSWTWNATMTVHDVNNTKKGYRAVLGQVGWALNGTKTWFVPPCTLKTQKDIKFNAPQKGDMSIGRQNS